MISFKILCKSVTPPRPLSRSRTNCFKGALDHSSNPDPYLVAGPTISKAQTSLMSPPDLPENFPAFWVQ